MTPTPGWKTTTFWLSLAAKLVGLAGVVGLVNAGDEEAIGSALAAIVGAVGVIVDNVLLVFRKVHPPKPPLPEPSTNGVARRVLPVLLAALGLALLVSPATAQQHTSRPAIGEYQRDAHGRLYDAHGRLIRPASQAEQKAFFFFFIRGRGGRDSAPQQLPADPAILQAIRDLSNNQQRLYELLALRERQAPAPAPAPAAPERDRPPTIIIIGQGQAPAQPQGSQPPYSVPLQPAPPYSIPLAPQPPYSIPLQPQPPYSIPLQPAPPYSVPLQPTPPAPIQIQPGVPFVIPLTPQSPGAKPADTPRGQGKSLGVDPGQTKPYALTPPRGYQQYSRLRAEPVTRAVYPTP